MAEMTQAPTDGIKVLSAFADPTSSKESIRVVIQVNDKRDEEYIGDFAVRFEKLPGFDKNEYVADWDTVLNGNGQYVDDTPSFWIVEAAARMLNEERPEQFTAINSGKNDI